MTGYECLIEELKKDGRFSVSKITANQALINAVVAILSKDEESRISISLAEKEKADIQKTRTNLAEWQQDLERREAKLKSKSARAANEFLELVQKTKKLKEEIHQLEEEKEVLSSCETEYDVRLFLFKKFKEEVNVSTVYDNTAYIYAAGAILGGESLPDFTPAKANTAKKLVETIFPERKETERRYLYS